MTQSALPEVQTWEQGPVLRSSPTHTFFGEVLGGRTSKASLQGKGNCAPATSKEIIKLQVGGATKGLFFTNPSRSGSGSGKAS